MSLLYDKFGHRVNIVYFFLRRLVFRVKNKLSSKADVCFAIKSTGSK